MKNFIRNEVGMLIFIALTINITQCTPPAETLFESLPSSHTGINFANIITESDSFNILTDEYIYNGAGVTIGDFNNDGLQDVFFTGNQVPNKLYLNRGDMTFEDVTDQANVNIAGRWNSGAVVVDINNDGWQDIFVCATMKKDSASRASMLFLNKGVSDNGIPLFEEEASRYGIADRGYNTMAAFFDYDRDGDLDLYILTNEKLNHASPSNYRPKINDGSSPNNDRLYRNNGNETFTNVTKEAGILCEGFGLGLAIGDVNNDGWPDIYVSNDFISNDVLYINNQNGTFTNRISEWMDHQSFSSMGNDAADINNDAQLDIITLDMLPETNSRKKTTINNKSYLNYINNEKYQYEYQYVRNMLHVNNGLSRGIGFSEIGQLAGIAQTEWSWSPLFADFDNDGFKDLLITNGFPKDITDKDFSNYRADVGAYVNISKLVDSIPVVKIPNYAFKNNGDLTFADVSESWGFTTPSFSNGAAFADLDNDGDLDYIINNINERAFVYQNTLITKNKKTGSHYLRVKLVGSPLNKQAIGATLTFYYDNGKMQYAEQQVSRGYLSSVEDIIHVGLGKTTMVDSMMITWPDGKLSSLKNIQADQVITGDYNSAISKSPATEGKFSEKLRLFEDVTNKIKLLHKHPETDKIDYNIQRTLPHKFSQLGPGIAVGDVNGDRRDDVVVGGSSKFPTTIFTQQIGGIFSGAEFLQQEDKPYEDEGLLLFDADADGDQDLYIVSGSIEFPPPSPYYQDRLYKNNGKGKFELDSKALPEINSSGSCVRAADFDADGDLDLFVGGRIVPGKYPYPAESYLLRNDKGIFSNVTTEICPEVASLGMITDALFTDFDQDSKIDLVVVGEFMPITFFANKEGRFKKLSESGLNKYKGWWNSITGGDFDGDGDIDYIAGNLGNNNGYQVSDQFPLKVYASDVDKNASIDAILACYIKESLENNTEKKLYPVHFWDELNAQSPRFRQQFSKYKQYAKATVNDLYTEEELKAVLILEANYFETSYVKNLGNGKFALEALPVKVQIAPVNGIIADDVNQDGNLDIVMVGNDYGNEVFIGRYDAFKGLVLLGDGRGKFTVSESAQNGFNVEGDAKGLAKLYLENGDELFVATQNRDSIKVFLKNFSGSKTNAIALEPNDSHAEFSFENGRKVRTEFYYGSGYLSQSSRKFKIPAGVREVVIYGFQGNSRKIYGANYQAKNQ